MNRTLWMSFGLLNFNNTMEIKTKSCGNETILYKVDASTACYLNYCSKIINKGKTLLYLWPDDSIINRFWLEYRAVYQFDDAIVVNVEKKTP